MALAPKPRPKSTIARWREDQACPVRDVLDRIGDAWTLLVLLQLQHGPCRFNALRRSIEGISQRMLTVTLRNLERDGMVARRVTPSAPPQVEYSLTEIGRSITSPIGVLTDWATAHQAAIQTARANYDAAMGLPARLPTSGPQLCSTDFGRASD